MFLGRSVIKLICLISLHKYIGAIVPLELNCQHEFLGTSLSLNGGKFLRCLEFTGGWLHLLPLHFSPKDFVGISDLTQGETGTQDATGTLSVDPLKPWNLCVQFTQKTKFMNINIHWYIYSSLWINCSIYLNPPSCPESFGCNGVDWRFGVSPLASTLPQGHASLSKQSDVIYCLTDPGTIMDSKALDANVKVAWTNIIDNSYSF